MKGCVAVAALSLFMIMGCDFIDGATGIPKLYDPALQDTETTTSTDSDSSTDTSTDTATDSGTDSDSSTDT